ncbi:Gfo/Idh/MocA family protein [uncultured Cellulomonas sp.]|uniref:Gfo/Idh/MocA family protein n=1 Tax=uncultured Cellulomonas sp. TaxID=189682 RepID=UPI00261B2529|nr:Gfo/Idh/MocA family oxidoreductase [uncultured Cellulomonas sp.]
MTSATALRRYAVAGTGHRSQMYVDAMLGDHADVAQPVAWCEPNPGRAAFYDGLLEAAGRGPLPRYEPDRLEDMICEQRVDVVVVTAPDHTHADLVTRALRAGADVVVEKPLTIDVDGCRRINAAIAETGRDAVMTFNYRYSPRNSSLKEVIASGRIGTVTSVHFEWALDTVHGADYFRRWHREKRLSGGLLVHKSSHHVDLVNWWLDDAPERVYARGRLAFYGDAGSGAAQAGPRPARGRDAEPGDRWSLDMTQDERLRRLYLDAEHHDGYLRDQDVFAPGITIEDTMAVVVDYRGGALLTYSLNAHAPWEGYRVTVNGSEGRAELEVVERGSVEFDASGHAVLDPSAREAASADVLRPQGQRLVVQRHWERAHEVPVPMGRGSHGGGDAILLADVFRGRIQDDPLGRPAGHVDGVRAVAVGIAANESMRTGQAVDIDALGLGADLRKR